LRLDRGARLVRAEVESAAQRRRIGFGVADRFELGPPRQRFRKQRLEASAPASRATRATSASRSDALRSSAKARARASAISVPASRSSATLKLAGTLASNGKRWSRRSQKAWIVWIFNPPGVSIARANSRRAKARPCAFGLGAPSSAIASPSAASSRPVHDASVSNTRAAILAAAVLVKVRHSRPDGAAPAMSSRNTR